MNSEKITVMRKLRLERKMKLKDVAFLLGVAPATICQYEKLTRTPSLKLYRKLQDFYDTTEDLFELVEPPLKTKK